MVKLDVEVDSDLVDVSVDVEVDLAVDSVVEVDADGVVAVGSSRRTALAEFVETVEFSDFSTGAVGLLTGGSGLLIIGLLNGELRFTSIFIALITLIQTSLLINLCVEGLPRMYPS